MKSVLLDSCAAIWLGNGAPMGEPALEAIRAAAAGDGVSVSVVTAWEIGLLSHARGKRPALAFLPDPLGWWRDLLALPGLREAPLTSSVALAASGLQGDLHNDPMDRLIIATARGRRLPVVTRDAAMLGYGRQGLVEALAC